MVILVKNFLGVNMKRKVISVVLVFSLILQVLNGCGTYPFPHFPNSIPPIITGDSGNSFSDQLFTPREQEEGVDVILQGIENIDSTAFQDAENLPPSIVFPFHGDQGEVIAPLFQDARAPFNGVIFNGPAIARVQVEFRNQQNQCLIDRRHDLSQVVARYNADVASLQNAMDTQRRMNEVILNQNNIDIQRLNQLLERSQQSNNGPHIGEGLIWATGGFLLGTVIFGGILIYTQVPH